MQERGSEHQQLPPHTPLLKRDSYPSLQARFLKTSDDRGPRRDHLSENIYEEEDGPSSRVVHEAPRL